MKKTGTSVAETMGHAHAALLEDLRQLEEAARSASGEGLPAMRARLEATHRHVTEHFRHEEKNGYMDEVRQGEPRLDRAIQQLAEEHCLLTQSLEALLGIARTATSLDDTLREEIRRWIEHVRQHEFRENDLIQDAFDLDIGTKD